MVARLIQQEQIRLADQRPGQQQTRVLAATQGGGLLLHHRRGKAHLRQQALGQPALCFPRVGG